MNGPDAEISVISARVDIAHTARLTGVIFRDAFGNDVTSQVSYTFSDGIQIYPADVPVTTPEPSTDLLFGCGVVTLTYMRRRRRAPANA